jgi:hypothetical protein
VLSVCGYKFGGLEMHLFVRNSGFVARQLLCSFSLIEFEIVGNSIDSGNTEKEDEGVLKDGAAYTIIIGSEVAPTEKIWFFLYFPVKFWFFGNLSRVIGIGEERNIYWFVEHDVRYAERYCIAFKRDNTVSVFVFYLSLSF